MSQIFRAVDEDLSKEVSQETDIWVVWEKGIL